MSTQLGQLVSQVRVKIKMSKLVLSGLCIWFRNVFKGWIVYQIMGI